MRARPRSSEAGAGTPSAELALQPSRNCATALRAPRGRCRRACRARASRACRRAPARRRRASERRAAHVGAERLRRRARRSTAARTKPAGDSDRGSHRADDPLLAARAGQVVLVRVAGVLARARERERLLAVEVRLLAGADAHRHAAVRVAAVDLGDDAAARVVDAAHRVDEVGEVVEAHLDDVVDVDAEVLLDRLDRERRAADRVGGVDLLAAVRRGCRRACRGRSTAGCSRRRRRAAA